MDTMPQPHIPPAPVPRTKPPSLIEMLRIVYRNPIELWGEPSYSEPWVHVRQGIGGPLLVANDPRLIRHILVDNAVNYRMARVRQAILRPILNDGLLTAERDVWRRSRKAMAPVFTPRHIAGFTRTMLDRTEAFAARYAGAQAPVDIAQDMTELTFDILSQTLFSGETAGRPEDFGHHVERLFETAGRIDPLDLIGAPKFLPRITRLRGWRTLAFFRRVVRETVDMREARIRAGEEVPDDFMTLLLRAGGNGGLTRSEIEDNVITFFGAGHETTARALGWTFYLLARSPEQRELVEAEIDAAMDRVRDPVEWLDAMPRTRAAFEEAMRLYPPAPTISREAIGDDDWNGLDIKAGTQAMIMPWTLHRHRSYWDRPDAFMPQRFWPENRDRIDRYQYLPFGAGARVCIGMAFALHEAVISLAVLMRDYRFDMAPGAPEPWPVQKLTTQPDGGLWMTVRRR